MNAEDHVKLENDFQTLEYLCSSNSGRNLETSY